MSEPTSPEGADLPGVAAASAGSLLRAAREAQGLHIAALAAAIKVSPRKLEALEADRYDELPDTTFTRALAQAVARSLKIDPRPVLERLPAAGPQPLAPGDGGLNQPFRDSGPRAVASGGSEPGFGGWRPMLWAAGLLLLAAALLYFLPLGGLAGLAGLGERDSRTEAPEAGVSATTSPSASAPLPLDADPTPGAASAAWPTPGVAASATAALPTGGAGASAAAASASGPMLETVFAAPSPAAVGESVAAPASEPPPAGVLVLRSTEASWIEVVDARGRTLLSRTLLPGEQLGLDGTLPFAVVVGNAEATELVFRGQKVDLAARGRDNVARLQLR